MKRAACTFGAVLIIAAFWSMAASKTAQEAPPGDAPHARGSAIDPPQDAPPSVNPETAPQKHGDPSVQQEAPPAPRPTPPTDPAWVQAENDDLLTIIKSLLKSEDAYNQYLEKEGQQALDGPGKIRLRTQFVRKLVEKQG